MGPAHEAVRLAAALVGDGSYEDTRLVAPLSAVEMRTITTAGKPFDVGLGWFRRPHDRDRSPAFVEHLGVGTSRSVNRNFSIRILYSDGDDFPEHVDDLGPSEVAGALNFCK